MRLIRHKRRPESNPDMTPLIDVVFLLIIFFMVVTSVTVPEARDIIVPQATTGEDYRASRGDITVNVRRNAEIVVSGRILTLDELETYLIEQGYVRTDEQLYVRLRADELTTYADIEPVMQACTRAGFKTIQFGVARPEDSAEMEIGP